MAADGFADGAARQHLRNSAEAYEALANNAEARLDRRKLPKPEAGWPQRRHRAIGDSASPAQLATRRALVAEQADLLDGVLELAKRDAPFVLGRVALERLLGLPLHGLPFLEVRHGKPLLDRSAPSGQAQSMPRTRVSILRSYKEKVPPGRAGPE